MFWVWLEWMVYTEPYNLDVDGESIILNEHTLDIWRSMPEDYRGMSIVIEIMMEND